MSSSVYAGQWVSMVCNESVSEVVADYVKIKKIFYSIAVPENFYICDVKVFGSKLYHLLNQSVWPSGEFPELGAGDSFF